MYRRDMEWQEFQSTKLNRRLKCVITKWKKNKDKIVTAWDMRSFYRSRANFHFLNVVLAFSSQNLFSFFNFLCNCLGIKRESWHKMYSMHILWSFLFTELLYAPKNMSFCETLLRKCISSHGSKDWFLLRF